MRMSIPYILKHFQKSCKAFEINSKFPHQSSILNSKHSFHFKYFSKPTAVCEYYK